MYSKRAIVFVPRSKVSSDDQRPWNEYARQSFFWECEWKMWDDWDLKLSRLITLFEKFRLTVHSKRQRWDETTEQRLHFARYLATVYLYNSRDFSNPQDVLRAFLGCLRRLGEDFADFFRRGFVYGLPRQKLHESLLWQPRGPAVRRKCNCKQQKESPHQYLPSWPWCGWQCELEIDNLHADQRKVIGAVGQAHAPTWEVKNSVHWELWAPSVKQMPKNKSSTPPHLKEKDGWPYLVDQAQQVVRFVRQPHKLSRTLGARRALHVRVSTTNFHRPATRQVVALDDAKGTWAGVLGLM